MSADEYQERRRRQNKLAQRRFRERRKLVIEGQATCSESSSSSSSLSAAAAAAAEARNPTPPLEQVQTTHDSFSSQDAHILSLVCRPHSQQELTSTSPSTQLIMQNLVSVIARSITMQPIQTSSFMMPSMHFAKALYENTRRMGIDTSIMDDYNEISKVEESWRLHQAQSLGRKQQQQQKESSMNNSMISSGSAMISPISSLSSNKSLFKWDNVPENMQPTQLQLNTLHHPYIDVGFVWPSMREKILCLLDTVIDDDELCHDTMHPGLPGSSLEPAFLLWGDDPMDTESWEVGERWAQKYWFLLDTNIIRRTNWWRRQRGLLPIQMTPSPFSSQIVSTNA